MLANEMLNILGHWQDAGAIRAIDLAIAKFLHQRDPQSDGLVLLAGALVSFQYGMGHTCLELDAFLDSPDAFLKTQKDQTAEERLIEPSPEEIANRFTLKNWISSLESSALVGLSDASAPLVLDGERLYLARNWDHEKRIASEISDRLQGDEVSFDGIDATLAVLFPTDERTPEGPDWQKISAALATEGRLLILTGGPGTGKTYTVARILALLQKDHPQRILLAAPTGKAAARLSESIAEAITKIPEALRKHAPGKAITIHQMLGASRHGRRYRHDEDTPLQADVVVIDEASMIDLEMMAAILKALSPSTRLILVGDKDQLASVEAGSVLGDLCKNIEFRGYTTETCQRIESLSGIKLPATDPTATDALAQRTLMLRYSKRFDEKSGIGRLAYAINEGKANEVLHLLEAPPAPHDIRALTFSKEPSPSNLREFIMGSSEDETISGYLHYLTRLESTRPRSDADDQSFIAWSKDVLESFGRFQILCALREGKWGVTRINALVEDLLTQEKLIQRKGLWYEGRPVMMTRNDYELGLMNGDVGMTLAFPNKEKTGTELKVAFRNEDGSMKFVLPGRLSEAETVYAMTIHKSQGSEFQHTVLIFPDNTDSPIMTRELIYTGVTRAKNRLTVICPDMKALADCVNHRIRRSGRLSERLGLPS